MTLACSNIAWSPEEDREAYALLASLGVKAVELAPARLWPDPGRVSEVDAVLGPLREYGLGVAGFQAILFQKSDLVLFDSVARPRLFAYLVDLAGLCARVGGRYLVFGAPKNRRVPEGMNRDEAWAIATDFFCRLGEAACKFGVFFGMEANPSAYGCNFCCGAAEAVKLVAEVGSPGFRWHVDAGALAMNGEPLPGTIVANAAWIGSYHAS
ncbi:MAG: sugar phosphate isomerase/epimerase [Verrucomicrobiia bacterium]